MKVVNNFFCIIFFFLFCQSIHAQDWRWLKQEGGQGYDFGGAIASDNSGNVYVTGSFDGNVLFGNTLLISHGQFDIFVAKYDSTGTLQWIRNAGGPICDYSSDVCVDDSGNVYIVGGYSWTVFFNSISLTDSTNNSNIFIAKYNSSGTLQWVKSIGGPGYDSAGIIKIGQQGNIVISGSFEDTVSFDSIDLISKGAFDFFIAEISSSGVIQWAKSAGGIDQDRSSGLIFDNSGNICVTGEFRDSAMFESNTIYSCGNYGQDMFLAKYDPSGNLIWVTKGGGTFSDRGATISSDANDNLYVSGECQATINFPAFFGNDTIYDNCTFFSKYDSNGNLVWFKKLYGDQSCGIDCNAMVSDAIGNSYLLCDMRDSASIENLVLYSGFPYSTELFIVKYDNAGVLQGTYQTSSSSYAMVLPRDMASDGFGNLLVTGMCNGVSFFDDMSTTNNNNSNEIFISKLYYANLLPVQEQSFANNLSVFPNPASDIISISSTNPSKQISGIQVYDQLGALVFSEQEILSEKSQINVSEFANGIYFLTITFSDGEMETHKIIVVK